MPEHTRHAPVAGVEGQAAGQPGPAKDTGDFEGGKGVKNSKTGSQIVGGNTAYKRAETDFYPTPPDVTFALLDFLRPPYGTTVIWDPACGEGHMVKQIRKMGYDVFGTDIKNGADFLTYDPMRYFSWIITNPPFSLSEQFIRRCGELKKPFAMLLKSQYWHAKRRISLFREYTPTWILPLTWRPDFCFGDRGGSPTMDVMWCVWGVNSLERPTYMPLERPDKLMVEVGF